MQRYTGAGELYHSFYYAHWGSRDSWAYMGSSTGSSSCGRGRGYPCCAVAFCIVTRNSCNSGGRNPGLVEYLAVADALVDYLHDAVRMSLVQEHPQQQHARDASCGKIILQTHVSLKVMIRFFREETNLNSRIGGKRTRQCLSENIKIRDIEGQNHTIEKLQKLIAGFIGVIVYWNFLSINCFTQCCCICCWK